MRFPFGMERQLYCNSRRQVMFTNRKRYTPPLETRADNPIPEGNLLFRRKKKKKTKLCFIKTTSKSVFSKYATFSGRARRSEFWYFYLFYILVALGLSFLSIRIPIAKYLYILFGLGVFLPYTAVTVRRLHDIGKSGWILLIFMVASLLISMLTFLYIDIFAPTNEGSFRTVSIFIFIVFALAIWFIVLMCKDSQPGENKWGPNPKEVPSTNV